MLHIYNVIHFTISFGHYLRPKAEIQIGRFNEEDRSWRGIVIVYDRVWEAKEGDVVWRKVKRLPLRVFRKDY